MVELAAGRVRCGPAGGRVVADRAGHLGAVHHDTFNPSTNPMADIKPKFPNRFWFRGHHAYFLRAIRADRSSTGCASRASRWYNRVKPPTADFMDRKDSAVNPIALDDADEAVKQFVLSLPVDANGSVLELDGRAVACVVPVFEEPLEEDCAWSEAKNARRCALIDKEIDGTLSAGEAVELHMLQREMSAHRRQVAPLPLAEARKIRQELLAKARRGRSE